MRLRGEMEAQSEQESLDRELSRLAWQDVKVYQESLRDERRKSLANRLLESRRQKESELMIHREALNNLQSEMTSRQENWQRLSI